MYPLKFENIYFNKIWGGREFELFRNNLPEGSLGESWDVSCHKHGVSIISNGKYKGMRLDEAINKFKDELLGTKISKSWFPLLIKLINANDRLSVQVHPDDKYARQAEGEMGKTEVWYVVEASEGASLVVGTNECTKEQFAHAIKNSDFDRYLNKIPVKKGDVYFVKSGLVHAIGKGVVIAEIQQNSDTTYRVYDYNRGRELHIDKALDVVDLTIKGEKSRGIKIEYEGYTKIYYCLCEHFSLELYDVQESFGEKSDSERFYIFTCVDGEGSIIYSGGEEKVNRGDSLLIPASLGEYDFKGNMKLLKSYLPDIKKVEEEILKEVLK